MKILAKFWPLGLFVVVGILLKLWAGAIGREAVLQQQVKAREVVIASLAKQKARVDTVAGKAAIVYKAAVIDYRHIADSIAATMQPGAPLPPIVRACNAAIAAADTALSACAKQVAVRDSIIWQQDSVIGLLHRRKPLMVRLAKPVLPFLGGVLTGLILTR